MSAPPLEPYPALLTQDCISNYISPAYGEDLPTQPDYPIEGNQFAWSQKDIEDPDFQCSVEENQLARSREMDNFRSLERILLGDPMPSSDNFFNNLAGTIAKCYKTTNRTSEEMASHAMAVSLTVATCSESKFSAMEEKLDVLSTEVQELKKKPNLDEIKEKPTHLEEIKDLLVSLTQSSKKHKKRRRDAPAKSPKRRRITRQSESWSPEDRLLFVIFQTMCNSVASHVPSHFENGSVVFSQSYLNWFTVNQSPTGLLHFNQKELICLLPSLGFVKIRGKTYPSSRAYFTGLVRTKRILLWVISVKKLEDLFKERVLPLLVADTTLFRKLVLYPDHLVDVTSWVPGARPVDNQTKNVFSSFKFHPQFHDPSYEIATNEHRNFARRFWKNAPDLGEPFSDILKRDIGWENCELDYFLLPVENHRSGPPCSPLFSLPREDDSYESEDEVLEPDDEILKV